MTKSNLIKLALSGLICVAGASAASAQMKYDSEKFWSQPHIRNAYLGNYEIDVKTEPKLSEEESTVFRAIIEEKLFETEEGKVQAMQRLLTAITPESTGALEFMVGSLYGEKSDLENAMKYFKQAVDKYPGFLRARRNLGIFLVQNGKYDEAIKHLVKAIDIGARDNTVFGLLGLCYVNGEQFISAETAYREAIMLDPTVMDWQLGLAKTLLNQKKYQEAIAVLDEILLKDPENEIIWISQANAYLGLDDPETAVAIQEIVDRLGKSSADSLEFMGNIYMSRGLNDLALNYYRKAISKDPNRPAATHVDTADILVARGAFDEAETLITDIRKTYNNKIDKEQETRLLRMESYIAMNKGLTDVFIPILEKLIEADPLDGSALLMLADHYSGQDTIDGYNRADIYYERVTKIEAMEVKALVSWARSYVSRQQYSKALPHLERANTIQPQDYLTRYIEGVRKIATATGQ